MEFLRLKFSPFLFLCSTGLFAIFSSTIAKSPVLPLFATHLGAGPSGVGLVASISAFAGVIFSVPAGILADRFGKRRLLVAAALVFATAPFGYLLVANIWQLALVRFYHGFATAIFLPVGMALVSSLSNTKRGEKLGWFSTATLAGRFMAPVVGGSILGVFSVSSLFGYQLVYAVCAAAGLITFSLALWLPIPEEQPAPDQSWAETFRVFKRVASNQTILLTCSLEAAILFAYGTFETFLPLYAVQHGLSTTQVGVFLSGQIIVLALSKPLMGKFSDKHGRRPQIIAGGLLGAVCIGAFSLSSSFLPMLLLSIGFGLCLAIVTSATSAFIADLSSQQARGSAMGLLGSIMDIGHTTGPLFSGLIASAYGLTYSFLGAAIVLFLIVGLFLFSGKTKG